MKQSPKIGLTMRLELETNRFYLGRDYCEALEHFGAMPLHISLIPKKDYLRNVLENLDGILLPGSDTDIDPLRFDEEPHPKLKTVLYIKEETDLLILEEAEKLKIPILGICFGMQALNVARGGTVYQDIESQISNSIKHEQGMPRDRKSHHITVKEESLLFTLTGSAKVKVNSHHHQAVKETGQNLKVTALAEDGVIECIEDTRDDRYVLGVQWHPELNWKEDSVSENIFQSFIDASIKYASKRS
ncbi:MAG TPA: gamma-glutamyl-gamma-aminobutyrate hydrolase family protein [Pyrinomonadaceae bacterium]|jgi:putative glutamine amidotransferase